MKKVIQSFLVMLIFVLPVFAIKNYVIPSPEDAFSHSVKKVEDGLLVNITPAKNIYVYDNKIKFEIIKPKVVDLTKEVTLPLAVKYKKWIVHFDPVEVKIPFSMIKKHIDGDKFTFRLSFQGCTTNGVCYAPVSYNYNFTLSPGKLATLDLPEVSFFSKIIKKFKSFSFK